jgi:Tol biopolymer transport system component
VKVIALFAAGALAAVQFSCAAKAPLSEKLAKEPSPEVPAGYEPARPELLEMDGENCCAALFPGAKQMAFLSRGRSRHAHFQVYIFDFERKSDRRLSFHDGDDQGVAVHPKTLQLFYASTTDANKEDPKFLHTTLGKTVAEPPNHGSRPLWNLENFEIYRTERDGTQIKRLTDDKGFDGEVAVNPKGQNILFTSVRDGRSLLMRADSGGHGAAVFLRGDGHDSQAQFSPDGNEVVFVRYAADGSGSQIMYLPKGKKKPKALTEGEGLRWSPAWHPDGNTIIFSSNHEDKDNFELYKIHKDGGCLRRLTYELGHDFLPAVWPDGKKLIYTSDRSGKHQLYSLEYRPQACP